MGTHISVKAADGHVFDAYVAEPSNTPKAALVVVQEIFGVNGHIRSVADDYAKQGYWTIAPALFDRVEKNVELTYEGADRDKGRELAGKVGMENSLLDVAAAIHRAAAACAHAKVGVVGFCWGGTLAWLAATRLDASAVVGYYGGTIARYADEVPRCPVILHFGEKDIHIPASEIDKIRKAHPKLPIYMYGDGHGFNCDQRKDFEPKSAALARQRSLDFLNSALSS